MNKIEKRIKYHKACVVDIEDHIKNVWRTYHERSTAQLDEKQLMVLLIWRKERVAEAEVMTVLHNAEAKWLEGLSDVPSRG
jgi:hypothetical protein